MFLQPRNVLLLWDRLGVDDHRVKHGWFPTTRPRKDNVDAKLSFSIQPANDFGAGLGEGYGRNETRQINSQRWNRRLTFLERLDDGFPVVKDCISDKGLDVPSVYGREM